MFKRLLPPLKPFTSPLKLFGIRSFKQLQTDLQEVLKAKEDNSQFQLDFTSLEFLRLDLSLPAYAGLIPKDGYSRIYHLFDRTGGGKGFSQRVTRQTCRDFRGGRLTYDQHDGVDFVCPPGTPLVAAAPGTVVMIRDCWLRGGLTVAVDHGAGLITQYTHCLEVNVELGQEVQRGETVALSGVSGMDMTAFFPWIPPHIHFMVWWNGLPVDPYSIEGESERPGQWLHGNDPLPSGPIAGDEILETSPINMEKLTLIAQSCNNTHIDNEISEYSSYLTGLAALIEDTLHHHRKAWNASFHGTSIRPEPGPEMWGKASKIKLTLPLPAEHFCGAKISDNLQSRP